MFKHTLQRRAVAAGGLAAMLMAGAAVMTAPVYAQQQSPSLDALVESGELPPVAERLPSNPLVVEPVESVGKYGGTWRSGLRGGGDNGWIARTISYEGLVRYDRNWEEVIPNAAASWEINEDATRYTFTLRDGLKWSDGSPVTSEDIAFAVEMYQDDEYPAAGGWMDNPNNAVTVEIESPTTFTLVFEKPYGLLMDELASVNGVTVLTLPKAYCSQFHERYNPEAPAMAEDMGYESWSLMMTEKCGWGWETQRWANPDLPTINPWVVKEPLTGTATRVVWERNPYYFKVDAEGNQLPYIDNLDMRVSESVEELTLLALNGEIDFQDRHIATNVSKPLFFDGQEQGDYRIGDNIQASSVTMLVQFNMNHDDPVKRELFQNKDFRIGFSHAIDRQEIVDVVFTGQGEPFQAAPRPESPFYDEELAKQYTEFDPELAIQHLEAAGLTEVNGDGIRLMSDGRPVQVVVDVISALRPEWIDMLEIMQLQLAEVGIDIEINNIDRTLFYEKRPGNDFDAQVWSGDGGLDVVQEPRYYFPFSDESVWAYRWAQWYNGTRPEIAEEPADWAKEQMALYDQIKAEGDPAKRAELMEEILAITKEEFPVVGVSLMPGSYYIAKNNLHNVADDMKHAWLFPTPAPYDPVQWYFE